MSSRIPLNVFQEYDQKKDFSLNEESLLINQRQSNVIKPKNLNDGLYDSNDLSVNEIKDLEKPTSYEHIDKLKRGPKIVEEVKVEPKVEIKIPQEYHHIPNDINPLVKINNDNSSSMLIIFVAIFGIFLIGSKLKQILIYLTVK